MESKRRRFSNVKTYQLVCMFSERAARNIVNNSPSPRSWSEVAKRQYQSLSHQAKVQTPIAQHKQRVQEWHYVALDETNRIEKLFENCQMTWQHCAFNILETWNKPITLSTSEISAGWKTCCQILTSHNHFLKVSATPMDSKEPTWQHAVWRIERLNRTEKQPSETAWQVAYRAIMRNDLRARRFGWHRAWMASKKLNGNAYLVGEKTPNAHL